MDSIYYAQNFINKLRGTSCLISRRKLSQEVVCKYPFFTLHQIVNRVLRKNFNQGDYFDLLGGFEMYDNVRKALLKILGRDPSKIEVEFALKQIRDHKNSYKDMGTTGHGLKLFNYYQSASRNNMDWEESLQMATRLLKEKRVKNLHNFHYDNIVLVQPELLNKPGNRNALAFFLELCKWLAEKTESSIYVVNNRGKVWQYQNQQFKLNNISKSSNLQSEVAAFAF
jgi:hypothetical protein